MYCRSARAHSNSRVNQCSDETLTVINYISGLKASLAAPISQFPSDSTVLAATDSLFVELKEVRCSSACSQCYP